MRVLTVESKSAHLNDDVRSSARSLFSDARIYYNGNLQTESQRSQIYWLCVVVEKGRHTYRHTYSADRSTWIWWEWLMKQLDEKLTPNIMSVRGDSGTQLLFFFTLGRTHSKFQITSKCIRRRKKQRKQRTSYCCRFIDRKSGWTSFIYCFWKRVCNQ